jgi:lipoprotein-anchoring transpeptidase ErfK/SrfK
MSLRRLMILAFIICLFTSCTAPPSNTNTAVTTTATPAANTTPVASTEKTSLQVTLPLLDALLTDDQFVAQLRQTLKLSEDQIEQLKRASSTEIDRLREVNAEEVDGNATDARTRAAEQLRTILGEQKANQLTALANEYWSKGDPATATNGQATEMLKGPNAVPTDTRVVVNIPAFRMDLFQDGSLVKSYKIGIGYPEFPLPLGLRKAQSIIFNPTWTPPDSPWVAKMKNVTPGETVAAGDKDNPLGPIKIPIGLPSLIHGGKSPAKIGKFASHGCVGLTNAQVKDFALLLAKAANNDDVSDQSITSYLADKEKTKTVKLNETVPVELRYETIVVEDGKLYIYKDVYAQDTNTEDNLRQVLEAHGLKFDDLSEPQRTEITNALNAMSTNPTAIPTPSPDASPAKKNAKTKKPAKPANEIVIDLGSAVAQKGYPAPVNLDDGRGKKLAADKRR